MKPGISLIYLLYFFIACYGTASGQTDKLKWEAGIKLKAGDIVVQEGMNYADVSLGYYCYPEVASPGKIMLVMLTEVLLDKKTSSVSDTSSRSLRYIQLVFDIKGYQSKLLKVRAAELGDIKRSRKVFRAQTDSLLLQTNREITLLIEQLDAGLKSGDPETTLSHWENKIAGLIRQTPDISFVFEPREWQVGIFMGPGALFFPGKTGRFFTNALAVNLGFQYDYKKSRFELDMNIGFNKLTTYLNKKGEWLPDTKTNFSNIEISYGYKIPKANWLTVPYLAMAVNEITPRKTDEEDKRRITGFGPAIGIELNRYLRTKRHNKEENHFFIRAKLSVNPSNFIKDIGGSQINLRLTAGSDGSLLRKRAVKKY